MSYVDGWAALNLDMPGRIPRTGYSAHTHLDLIRAVTAMDVSAESPEDVKQTASQEFVRKWNCGLWWCTLITADEFGDTRTNMGHAAYAAGGVDYDSNITSPFADPEQVLAFAKPEDMLGDYKSFCKVA